MNIFCGNYFIKGKPQHFSFFPAIDFLGGGIPANDLELQIKGDERAGNIFDQTRLIVYFFLFFLLWFHFPAQYEIDQAGACKYKKPAFKGFYNQVFERGGRGA